MRVSEVFAPTSLIETLSLIRKHPDALLWAGGTGILRLRVGRRPELPPTIISLEKVPELRAVGRSDRTLDLGATVVLSQLSSLGEGAVPEALAESAAGIGTEALRNLATLGGNILCRERFGDAFPALACLDALAEFRGPSGSRWMAVGRLAGKDRKPLVPPGEILIRVRVPLDPWDLSIVRKIGYPLWPDADSGVFACLARASKGSLYEFRAAMGGPLFLRDRDTESALIGKRLPLQAREIENARQSWRARFEENLVPRRWIERFLAAVDEAFDALRAGVPR
ncbi:MAG: FAD binding domain-containing protein [Spirochaetales bacterium]|nr:FAD binding domain-containing protein [Spirochaetales bacterium]